MTLDPRPSDAELMAMAARRSAPRKSSRMVNPIARKSFAGVTIVVPFKHLRPDNSRYMVMRGQRRLVLAPEYRQAKETIRAIALRAMVGQSASKDIVTLDASVYMPDARRRDLQNFSKLLCDAIEGVVYEDDTLIRKATWRHMGIDRAEPRVILTITGEG